MKRQQNIKGVHFVSSEFYLFFVDVANFRLHFLPIS